MENKKINVLLEMADDNDGYVSVSDAARFGIAPTFISYLVELGQLTRIAKGLYIKKGYEIDRYYLLHYIYKKMVFGYESSLYLHGLINEPSIPDIVLPLNYMTKGIEGTLSRHLGNKEFQTGQILLVTPKGNLVPGYDLERLFIETIKRADDLDKGTIVSRLTAIYSKGIYKDKLDKYAKAFHLEGEVNLAIKLIGLDKLG